ncbi:MAG: hypothetical protein GX299_02460 [Epulopiscium sp.]|jgi:hypothetical protein|nr:hypothetical protein [Candidatus Epulonipiscium sp.]
MAIAFFSAISISFLNGLYKYPMFYRGGFTATKESAVVFILLWGFVFGSGVLFMKYSVAKKGNGTFSVTLLYAGLLGEYVLFSFENKLFKHISNIVSLRI